MLEEAVALSSLALAVTGVDACSTELLVASFLVSTIGSAAVDAVETDGLVSGLTVLSPVEPDSAIADITG
ncbi:hypothetical protein SSIN_0197 [Streptococcus sinensis]|uniref:Uncharacterized protein n=1 Tax=Streptococcus sinensis TaxID=176090 RepID=A0A0A0DGY6_9STRE|nr:hypothetical protein SSIN_0197 [Streptococcus sinensis]